MGVNKWCYGHRDLLILFGGSHSPFSSLAPLLPCPRKRIRKFTPCGTRVGDLGPVSGLSGCPPITVDYDLRVPEGMPPEEGWPVIVAVHGLRGNGPDTCDTWADIAAREGYLLACPSFNDEERYWEFDHGEVEAIDQILSEVAAAHPLDLPIYLTGISAGGRFTHRYTFNYPERVRAAAVVADASNQDYEPAALEVPLFWAMGAKDTDWAPRLQPLIEDLETAGFQVESYVDPEAGHA